LQMSQDLVVNNADAEVALSRHDEIVAKVDFTIERAQRALLAQQHPEGYWQGLPKPHKMTQLSLLEIKRRLSPKLMPFEFVSGIGVAGGKLAVYLLREAPEKELKQISDLVNREAPGTKVEFVTTGEFGPH
jgi:hypothetical protein